MTAITWKIDNVRSIGGFATTACGNPRVVAGAVEFDGVGDGLLVDIHPMAGWTEFTLEIVFRPDAGGPKEQRFLHLQVDGSEDRILIETRLTGDGRLFLDTFIKSGSTDQALFAKDFLHPVGKWHAAALVFDGTTMSHFVNGAPELSAPIAFTPPRSGRTSIGMRANQVWWFKGAIGEVRMTRRALAPLEFLRAD